MTTHWTESAIKQWESEGIKTSPGISLDVISQAEKILEFTLPQDFKDLYLKANGFFERDWRPNMFSIWPIELILLEYSETTNKNQIAFSDYLINSYQLGFLKNNKGIFILYGDNPTKIAHDFSEAIHLINSDSEKIYL